MSVASPGRNDPSERPIPQQQIRDERHPLVTTVALPAESRNAGAMSQLSCPGGCDCTPVDQCPFTVGFVVDCWLVEDCDVLYPGFCSDMRSECENYCLNKTGATLIDFKCTGVDSDCEAECLCDPECIVCC